jgi:hypothetical protein
VPDGVVGANQPVWRFDFGVLAVPAPVAVAVPVYMMAVTIYVMAMRIDPVTETIVPWSGEIMVRINVSPTVGVAAMMIVMSVVRIAASTRVVVMAISRVGRSWDEKCGAGEEDYRK